jgi:hypothetical protein
MERTAGGASIASPRSWPHAAFTAYLKLSGRERIGAPSNGSHARRRASLSSVMAASRVDPTERDNC